VSNNQLNKNFDDIWKKKKLYLWIIGGLIIVALILYYILSKNEKSIELISFIASISSIVLAISTIIVGKCYNKATGEVLEHIESLTENITDELQHRLNGLEDMEILLEKLPESMAEKNDLLDKVKQMEEEIITSPLLASQRSHHEDFKIRKYEKKIRSGQRKLYKYDNDLKDDVSEKEKIKMQNKTNNVEEKIKVADDKLKKITTTLLLCMVIIFSFPALVACNNKALTSGEVTQTVTPDAATESSTPVVEPTEPTNTETSGVDADGVGADVVTTTVNYENTEYGFDFALPDSWKNYTIVTDTWNGNLISDTDTNKPDESGPIISIRHPEWTEDSPRQDIPIMVFTYDQWALIESEDLAVSAAPIGPSELGRNSVYVFALPARYNFAYITGYEEVNQLITDNSFSVNENISKK